jgi:hypothetical protein
VDLRVAAEAVVETTLGVVIPVMADESEEKEAEEIEPGPVGWPMWW